MRRPTGRNRGQMTLPILDAPVDGAVTSLPRALEDPAFPFEYLSEIAELESWRKEINRPI